MHAGTGEAVSLAGGVSVGITQPGNPCPLLAAPSNPAPGDSAIPGNPIAPVDIEVSTTVDEAGSLTAGTVTVDEIVT